MGGGGSQSGGSTTDWSSNLGQGGFTPPQPSWATGVGQGLQQFGSSVAHSSVGAPTSITGTTITEVPSTQPATNDYKSSSPGNDDYFQKLMQELYERMKAREGHHEFPPIGFAESNDLSF